MKIENFPVNFKSTKLNQTKQNENDDRKDIKDIKPQMNELYSSDVSSSIKALNSSSINFRGSNVIQFKLPTDNIVSASALKSNVINRTISIEDKEKLIDELLASTCDYQGSKIPIIQGEYLDEIKALAEKDFSYVKLMINHFKRDKQPDVLNVANDIIESYDSYFEDKDTFLFLANQKATSEQGTKINRIPTAGLSILVKLKKNNPEIFDYILNHKIHLKEYNKNGDIYRTMQDIELFFASNAFLTDEGLAYKFFEQKESERDLFGRQYDMFTPLEVYRAIKGIASEKIDINKVEELSQEKTHDIKGRSIGARFNMKKTVEIAKLYSKYPQLVDKCLDEKIFSSSAGRAELFVLEDIKTLVEVYHKWGQYSPKEYNDFFEAYKQLKKFILEMPILADIETYIARYIGLKNESIYSDELIAIKDFLQFFSGSQLTDERVLTIFGADSYTLNNITEQYNNLSNAEKIRFSDQYFIELNEGEDNFEGIKEYKLVLLQPETKNKIEIFGNGRVKRNFCK